MKRPLRGIKDNKILTSNQKEFLNAFIKSDLRDVFRFTGGTVLSAFYLEHRLSEDLEFFSSEKIPFYVIEDFLRHLEFIESISHSKLFDRNIFSMRLKDGSDLITEFTYYPLKNLEDIITIEGVCIDSFVDIVVNKLCAMADRVDVKDYVDVYCALVNSDLSLKHLLDLTEKKCEIKGIWHILKSRLLQVPEGIGGLALKIELTKTDIDTFFKDAVRGIVREEIDV